MAFPKPYCHLYSMLECSSVCLRMLWSTTVSLCGSVTQRCDCGFIVWRSQFPPLFLLCRRLLALCPLLCLELCLFEMGGAVSPCVAQASLHLPALASGYWDYRCVLTLESACLDFPTQILLVFYCISLTLLYFIVLYFIKCGG